MGKNYIWIGPRVSDIDNDIFFSNSITTYGNGKYSFTNKSKRIARGLGNEISFIENSINEICSENPNAKFMLYDQTELGLYNDLCKEKIICTNSVDLLQLLNSKQFTRAWFSNYINCLPFVVMPFSDCSYEHLCRIFPGVDLFTIQNIYGVGGTKTYIIDNDFSLNRAIQQNKAYDICIAAPYMKNSVSLNIHLICTNTDIILFPFSKQIISIYENKLLYTGNDFTISFDCTLRKSILEYSYIIGTKMKSLGYKGIAGIDFLWVNNKLYFLEINPRFQGSTKLLNVWLKENNYSSIFQMNWEAFYGNVKNYHLEYETIPYISYNSISGIENTPALTSQYSQKFQDFDGWTPDTECMNGVYKYRKIYKFIPQ